MTKEFKYERCTVRVHEPESNKEERTERITNALEKYMKAVISKEGEKNGKVQNNCS